MQTQTRQQSTHHFLLHFSYFVKEAVNLRPYIIKEVGQTLLPKQSSTAIWGVVTKLVINK